MSFYKVEYQGFAIIEADSPEEAEQNVHEYCAIYEEEEITKITKIGKKISNL